MIEKKLFLLLSVIVVLLMYFIPYGLLNGIEGPLTFIFWTGISVAYLIFVAISMRR
ncbi:MAG: hypothetical protein N3D12_03535 [Candidatus Methanomethyliaceae archaeon]|nr:hypothetical protein [Candidatus Methanomethyliaceae archaeon]